VAGAEQRKAHLAKVLANGSDNRVVVVECRVRTDYPHNVWPVLSMFKKKKEKRILHRLGPLWRSPFHVDLLGELMTPARPRV